MVPTLPTMQPCQGVRELPLKWCGKYEDTRLQRTHEPEVYFYKLLDEYVINCS